MWTTHPCASRHNPILSAALSRRKNKKEGSACFDDAVAIGDWVHIEGAASLQISVGGKAITLSAEDVAIDKVVAHLSRYFTFKIGDIVVPLVTDVTLPIALDRTITGEMKNTEVLNLKIK
mgnify:CR=1 FL=1